MEVYELIPFMPSPLPRKDGLQCFHLPIQLGLRLPEIVMWQWLLEIPFMFTEVGRRDWRWDTPIVSVKSLIIIFFVRF